MNSETESGTLDGMMSWASELMRGIPDWIAGIVRSFGGEEIAKQVSGNSGLTIGFLIAAGVIVVLAFYGLRLVARAAFARPAVANKVSRWGDADFVSAVHAESVHGRHRSASLLLAIIVLFFIVILTWADHAILDEVTTGQGKVIPSSQLQVVQNLEGGIVKEILVHEGNVVDRGQILIRIDDTGFAASYGENQAKRDALRTAIIRLTAEIEGKPIKFPKELVRERPEIVQSENQLYELRQDELRSQVGILKDQVSQRRQELAELGSRLQQLKRSFAFVNEELELTRPLIEGGAVSRVEVLRLEREVNDLRGDMESAELSVPRAQSALAEARRRISEKMANFRADAQRELNDRKASLAVIREAGTAAKDRVVRADVRSPVRGTVKQLKVATIGGVVRPGMDLVEIVPLEDNLLVEARIRPTDIGFLRPGQKAKVKITAYDFSIYGGLDAQLEYISSDTITDERGESFYQIRVRTNRSFLGTETKPHPIIPGMTASVDILTGHKSVLDYLLKPILKTRERALRER